MQGEQDQPQQHNNQDEKVNQQQTHGQQHHHEPLKCPRCESLNTKFCYYNNYSLSQPRYFCKGCRRYWTHGGTLRNVPVGGGCRKGKRAKIMSSTSSSCSMFIQPQQQPQDHHQRSLMMSSGPLPTLNSVPGSQYYPGAGYLTSLPFSQNITHLGGSSQFGSGGGASNLGLLHSFNAISSHGQGHTQSQLFRSTMEPSALYPSKDHRGMLFQPTSLSGVMIDWPQSFINKSHASASNVAASTGQTTIWSASIGNNTSITSGANPSINSTHWSDDLDDSFAAGPPQ